jgi:hypothetical protein
MEIPNQKEPKNMGSAVVTRFINGQRHAECGHKNIRVDMLSAREEGCGSIVLRTNELHKLKSVKLTELQKRKIFWDFFRTLDKNKDYFKNLYPEVFYVDAPADFGVPPMAIGYPKLKYKIKLHKTTSERMRIFLWGRKNPHQLPCVLPVRYFPAVVEEGEKASIDFSLNLFFDPSRVDVDEAISEQYPNGVQTGDEKTPIIEFGGNHSFSYVPQPEAKAENTYDGTSLLTNFGRPHSVALVLGTLEVTEFGDDML